MLKYPWPGSSKNDPEMNLDQSQLVFPLDVTTDANTNYKVGEQSLHRHSPQTGLVSSDPPDLAFCKGHIMCRVVHYKFLGDTWRNSYAGMGNCIDKMPSIGRLHNPSLDLIPLYRNSTQFIKAISLPRLTFQLLTLCLGIVGSYLY